jgi:histidinol-phosphate/aromatic aminotransferase/cobyric acid decarboxylase-like protein/choline kinase
MKAIILAAGYGRRMQPLSDACHKALLPVGSTTILGRIVDALLSIDVRDVVVVTGYRDADVRAFLSDRYPDVPFEYVHNARFDTTNNIVSLSLALDQARFDEDVLLLECDLLFDPALLRRLASARAGNTALVDRYRAGMDGTVVAVEDGVITHVYPPHLQGRDFFYGDKFKTLNIYRFDREFCRATLQPLLNCYANLIDGNCYYELVLGMLVNMQRQRIAAEIVDGQSWAEVDDPNDLTAARFTFEPDRRAEILDRAFGGHWNFDVLDFAFMANAYFPTDAMVAAFRQAMPDLLRAYGSTQAVLNQKLGYARRCRADRVQALHGASQAFPLLPSLFGDRPVLIPTPTFGEYARLFPAAATYADSPGYRLADVAAALPPHGVLVVVNPNSPSGTTVSSGAIYATAARRPDALVFVDESFIDFSGERSIIERLEHEPLSNVIVLTSLSKSLGVPGLRLGFVYATDPDVIARIGAALPVWNLSAPAEYLLELLLKYRTELDVSIQRTIDDRAALAADLSGLPLVERVFPSGGNFLLVTLTGDDPGLGARVRQRLLADHRIEVKDVSGRFGRPEACLRIAVRRAEDNARFVSALATVAASIAVTTR